MYLPTMDMVKAFLGTPLTENHTSNGERILPDHRLVSWRLPVTPESKKFAVEKLVDMRKSWPYTNVQVHESVFLNHIDVVFRIRL